MKPDAIIINTSRRGIFNEHDLYEVMYSGDLSGTAIDVFEKEPYEGPLKEIERCLPTAPYGFDVCGLSNTYGNRINPRSNTFSY